ncbi:hypothetical protein GCM10007904_23790 [Oharaeibacter diazotrophicus]|nr:hypothetical protein GCM10007904_23790 [Oharaeibacter diazotrophicus]
MCRLGARGDRSIPREPGASDPTTHAAAVGATPDIHPVPPHRVPSPLVGEGQGEGYPTRAVPHPAHEHATPDIHPVPPPIVPSPLEGEGQGEGGVRAATQPAAMSPTATPLATGRPAPGARP